LKIKFIAIILIAGFVLGTFSISNTVYASEAISKLFSDDKKGPPASPPGLEKAGMTRVVSSTTSEIDISEKRQKGCTVIHKLEHVTSFFCPSEIVATLDNVRPEKIYHPHGMDAVEQIDANLVWPTGYDGSGVDIAILDTGVQGNHREIVNSIYAVADFTGQGGENLDLEGHGTHVAGIIVGAGYPLSFTENLAKGVAPGAKIHVGKVCGFGGCAETDIIAGIEWAKNNQEVDVINMSLGGGSSSAEYCVGDAVVDAVNSAAASGIIVTISSGNDYFDNAVSYPGCAQYAIAVGAVNSLDQPADFSNKGPALDVVAPGVSILSSWSCNDWDAGLDCGPPANPISWYNTISGTSMASPMVAGLVALMLDKNPDLTFDDVMDIFESTSIPIQGANFPGERRVDAFAAVNAVPGVTNPPSNDSDGDSFDDVNLGGTDCDDTDDTIYPGAAETAYDGTDSDCDGLDPDDVDLDGSTSNQSVGGTPDCDDTDDTVFPGATEIPDNGIDEDCNDSDTISVHVEDLTWEATNKKNWKVDIFITVHSIDADHSSVSGVSVQGTLTGGEIVNCTTDDSGTCKITKTTRLGQLTFTVDSLSGSDFVSPTIDPHDLDGDSNIDVLTVTIDRGSSFGEDTPPDDPPEDPPQDKCNPGMKKKNQC